MLIDQFITKWQNQPGKEKQQDQDFIRDLISCYDVDPDTVQWQYKVRNGYIDAFIPGIALFEVKSKGVDLDKADKQVNETYLPNLKDTEKPRYIITTDFAKFRIYDRNSISGPSEFSLSDLQTRPDYFNFLKQEEAATYADNTGGEASVQAANLLAQLYTILEKSNYNSDHASIFMIRLLFLLYADDAGMLPAGLFTEFIAEHTTPENLGSQLVALFQVLNKSNAERQVHLSPILNKFPYVNGGIFDGNIDVPMFDQKMREHLITCCDFDWAKISPAIFGSLFQAVKSKEDRRKLGEHYTTETNILKLLKPLFLDELTQEFRRSFSDINKLKKLQQHLGEFYFLDPACGCGNFLIIAYREMRNLELRIEQRLLELDSKKHNALSFSDFELSVQLNHFAGLEIEDWPAQIAKVALQLAKHQSDQKAKLVLGAGPDPFPLKTINTIHNVNALEFNWSNCWPQINGELLNKENVIIMGNPPFVGHQQKTKEQSEEVMQIVGVKDVDYVVCWYHLAADFFKNKGRFAFVSTNSISQGVQPALWMPKLINENWRIYFAYRTFPWETETTGKAAVHCVIIGFEKGGRKTRATLFGKKIQKIENINPYLVSGPNIFLDKITKPLSSLLPEVFFGSMPNDGGNLLLNEIEAKELKKDKNIVRFIRPFIGAKELLHGYHRYCLWLVGAHPSEYLSNPIIKERIQKVKQHRLKSSQPESANYSQLFFQIAQPKESYLCIPGTVSETREYFIAAHFSKDIIASNAVFTALDSKGILFALISSKMFILWQETIGGRLESRLRFSKDIVWNNFPVPEIENALLDKIISASKVIITERKKFPNISLAEQYSPLAMDTGLLKAHQNLDKLVDSAFGLKNPTDDERLTKLFDLYQKITNTN